MSVKKLTRKKVNDPIIDSAFRDVYSKLDKLQPSPPNDVYTNINKPEIGTVTTVEVSGNEAESGTISTAVYTKDGWMVDINSTFKKVGTRGFISSEGTKGRDKTPTQGEALSYDKNKNVKILNSKGEKALLKNVGGTLQVRNQTDSADADVRASRFTFDNAATAEGLTKGQLAYNHSLNQVTLTSNFSINTGATGSIGDPASLSLLSYRGDAYIQFWAQSTQKWQIGYDRFSGTFTDATCDTTDGSTTVEFTHGGTIDADPTFRGSTVSGTGIQANTFVESVNTTENTLTLSKPVLIDGSGTTTGTNVTLTFQSKDEKFKIHDNNTFADTSVFNLSDAGALELFGTSSSLKLSYDANDSCTMSTGANGATVITTVDSDGAAGHLSVIADGDIILGSTTGRVRMYDNDDATKYTDLAVNSSNGAFKIDSGDEITLDSHTGVINFRDAGDTDDAFKITVVGGTGVTTLETVSDGADGHMKIVADGRVEFDGCGVGFDLVAPSYNSIVTDVDFRTGNKQHVVFGSGDITNLQLTFPAASGNFQVLLKQDGTGSRTITNYRVYNAAESLVGAAKFPGGSNPTLTTDANHVDIISFYWDADNEIAYGVATLDFQF